MRQNRKAEGVKVKIQVKCTWQVWLKVVRCCRGKGKTGGSMAVGEKESKEHNGLAGIRSKYLPSLEELSAKC